MSARRSPVVAKAACLLILPLWITALIAQVPIEAVPLTAIVTTAPPTITLNWPGLAGTPFHKVFRKQVADTSWTLRMVLPGNATEWNDTAVTIGEVYEYGVARSLLFPVLDTTCVPPGTEVTFSIQDVESDGLCCSNSHGSWRLSACDQVQASGGAFGATEQTSFIVCGTAPCTPVIIRIDPDHVPGDITWQLTDDQGNTLASGGPYAHPQFGTITSGIAVEPIDEPGALLLLVDDQQAAPLAVELARLEEDLYLEGWQVVRMDVDATTPPTALKNAIQVAHDTLPDLHALLLVGDLPVAYSGRVMPDGHLDHRGAYPSDLYYAELDGPWTDNALTWSPGNVPVRNHNLIGDGRFDQSVLPSDVDLIMGRIDFSALPVFTATETELLRSYLDRDHAFRIGELPLVRSAVVDANFTALDLEASMYRSCIPMFGGNQVQPGDLISTLATSPHLWAHASGPGTFTGAVGVGTSANLASTPLLGTFAHLVGSYFADWDTPDNFMRSVLASGTMLGTVWGFEEMQFHSMGLGGTIGEAVRRSQNSDFAHAFRMGRGIHLALMGDPTLTLFPVKPAGVPLAVPVANGVRVDWTPSLDPVDGYHVYRRTPAQAQFERVTSSPVADTTFLDPSPFPGSSFYMVRALKNENGPSGTFGTLSAGRAAQVTGVALRDVEAEGTLNVHPDPSAGEFTVRSKAHLVARGVRLLAMDGAELRVQADPFHSGLRIRTEAPVGTYVLVLPTEEGPALRTRIVIAR